MQRRLKENKTMKKDPRIELQINETVASERASQKSARTKNKRRK